MQVQVVGFHILIWFLNSSKEFRFLYRFGTVLHVILPLKHIACVCVCVCVCVCLYSSTVKASSDCKMFKTYLRGTDQRSCVVNIYLGAFCQVPSSPFPNLSYFTSKDVTPARQKTGEKKEWYNVLGLSKRWYILI